jgi:N-glycosylase/DNA lyase
MRITLNQKTTPFNLDHTLQCGQVFRWKKHDDWWYGIVTEKPLKIRQKSNMLEFEGTDADFIKKYFRLDDPLPLILSKINKDAYIRKAIQNFHGLRLIRQNPWECLISYICATYKNIPASQNMINNLAKQFGHKTTLERHTFYTFPTPKRLANASITKLAHCKLGFRAKNIQETAKKIHQKTLNLTELEKTPYETAKNELLKLPGVGNKVADCVLLFSLNKLEAFPIDVWMKKIMLENYHQHFDDAFVQKASKRKPLTTSDYKRIGSFARDYFGKQAGYAQQYLFHQERSACQVA